MDNQEFLKKVLDMPQKEIKWEVGKSYDLSHEFMDKVFSIRQSYIPSSGDYSFCMEEELDNIVSLEPTIIVKYPKCTIFGYNAQYYNVTAKNRYITWRDILESLEREKNRLEEYNNHRFIEFLEKTTDIQYELCCGS